MIKMIGTGLVFLCFSIQVIMAQSHQVSGVVTDEQGQTLDFVNIIEKGTTNGTVTRYDGTYQITLRSPQATLVFSFVGYSTQEIEVDGRSQMDVTLEQGIELSGVYLVGSRSYNRSVTDTPVPVDVINMEDISGVNGQLDLNQLLQYAAPSFNANRQSGADGADHIDPATLRGLGPDQTLVLVNGHRRHQSSHINIFGSRGRGNTGTDLNTIPVAAIDRIEILRDGASAQYGSDAIAGVINIVLKSDTEKTQVNVTAGAHQAKLRDDQNFDGENVQISTNFGTRIFESGFVNLTLDYLNRAHTWRPADPDQFPIYRRQFGVAAADQFSAWFNSRIPLSEQTYAYAFGGYSYRDTDAFAFTRAADSDRNIPEIYPNGFDPRIQSSITDRSFSAGLRTFTGGWEMDINNTYGSNRFHYFVDETLNASLLEASQTRFDAGGFELHQNTTGITMSRYFSEQRTNLALGLEHRVENYQIFAGEEASWQNYGVVDSLIDGRLVQIDILGRAGGAQGFPGFRPENEVNEFRTNLGAFIDVEADITNWFMVSSALRFERYSDFGNTLNAKLAARFRLTDELVLRGSAGTGFRAPSLPQIHFNSTFSDFVSGQQVDILLARNNSAIAQALGIESLKEEKARNAGLGVTYNWMGRFTATIDAYYIEIRDRIVLTGSFEDDDPDIGDELQRLNVGGAQFFTNALDTETFGLDVILSYLQPIGSSDLTVTFAGNFNEMNLGEIKTSPALSGKEDIYFGEREQRFLLASAPNSKMNLSFNYATDRWTTNLRLNRFGKVKLLDFDEEDGIYNPKITIDVSVGYQLFDHTRLTIGAVNLFNVYPDRQNTETESGGYWDPVQMGFSGAFFYSRLHLRF